MLSPEQRADKLYEFSGWVPYANNERNAFRDLLPPGSRVVVPSDGYVVLDADQAEKDERERNFILERGAVLSEAVGLARLKLQNGDAEGAKVALDRAADKTFRMYHEALARLGQGADVTPEQRADKIRDRALAWPIDEEDFLSLLPPGSRVVVPGDGYVVLDAEQAKLVQMQIRDCFCGYMPKRLRPCGACRALALLTGPGEPA